MTIGIDTNLLKTEHALRGIGIYTQHLIKALQKLQDENFRIKISNIETQFCDIIHYPYFDFYFLTLPLKKQIKTVVTIHDVTPLIFPQYYSAGLKGKLKFFIQRFSLKGVSAVITDSENSKRDIAKYLNYSKEKIYVVYLATGEEFKKLETKKWKAEISKKYNLPERFVLYVGDVNYNKNVEGLIKAFGSSRTLSSGLKLVLVGKSFTDNSLPEVQRLLQLIKQLGLEDKIILPGWIPEEDLVKIYNLAEVYCQPSFYEGFGLPVLEAMACGCPVVCANSSSLPEVCGEAALMVDPHDDNGIAKAIERITTDRKLTNDLIEKGFKQSKKFFWEKTAKETVNVYHQIANEKLA